MVIPQVNYITEQEYLDAERASLDKHEYYKGEVFKMSGASKSHNEISANCIYELKSKLKGKTCRTYGSDFRINIPNNTLYTYPDISIFCNDPNIVDTFNDTATNPSVIIEILSKSTRNYDMGQKFELYRQIDSLLEYILIDSEKIKVFKHTKNPNGSWLLTEYVGLESIFIISSLQIELNLADIYDNVKFI